MFENFQQQRCGDITWSLREFRRIGSEEKQKTQCHTDQKTQSMTLLTQQIHVQLDQEAVGQRVRFFEPITAICGFGPH